MRISKRWSLFICLCALFIVACDSADNSHFPAEVTYQVSGTPQTAKIEYTEHDSLIVPFDPVTIPWTHSFQASEEQILSFFVLPFGCKHRLCDLDLSILVNDETIKQLSIHDAIQLNPDTLLLELDSSQRLGISAWNQADSIALQYNILSDDVETGTVALNTSTKLENLDLSTLGRGATIRDTVPAGFPAFIEVQVDQKRSTGCIGLHIFSTTINFKNQHSSTGNAMTELCIEESGSARVEIDIP